MLCITFRRNLGNEYISSDGFRPTLFKETVYNDGKSVVSRANSNELYAFLDASKNRNPIIVGGLIRNDRLIADIFIFDKNHLFVYLIK